MCYSKHYTLDELQFCHAKLTQSEMYLLKNNESIENSIALTETV